MEICSHRRRSARSLPAGPADLRTLLPAAPALLLATLLLTTAACGGEEEGGGQQQSATPVEVVEVESVSLRDTVGATGTLRALETVELASEAAGTVQRVHFEEGARVEQGQRLVTLNPEKLRSQLAASRSAVEAAEARVELTRRTYERVETLFDRGSASREELDRVETDFEQATAEAARLASETDLAGERLSDTAVYAPTSGHISERLVDVGDFVDVGQPLATLYRTDPLEIAFGVPERAMGRLRPGQEVTATVSAYPEREIPGTVGFISPSVDEATRTFLVKARVDNSEGLLKPGSFADVRVTLERRTGRPAIPEEALVSTRTGYVVFVVEDGKAHRREVEIGLREPGRVEIREGLEVGETVVKAGQMRLAEGAEVEVVEDLPGGGYRGSGLPRTAGDGGGGGGPAGGGGDPSGTGSAGDGAPTADGGGGTAP